MEENPQSNSQLNRQSNQQSKPQSRNVFLKIWNNRFFSLTPVRYALLAFAINLFSEAMNQQSLLKAFVFLGTRPHLFLYGTIIILATLSIGVFFRKRIFATSLISLFWVGFSITNLVILNVRKTPFSAPDLLDLKECFLIIPKYFNVFQMILLGLFFLVLIGGIVFGAIKSPKLTRPINYMKCIAFSACSILLAVFLSFLGIVTGVLEKNMGNLKETFANNGFSYCFVRSALGGGVGKPEDYSPELVDNVLDDLEETDASNPVPTASSTDSDIPSEGKDSLTTEDAENTSKEDSNSTNTGIEESDSQGSASQGSASQGSASQGSTSQESDSKETTSSNETTTQIPDAKHPNIIFLQLESLFDPTLVKGVDFSSDPIPTLHSLYDKYSSGYLNVPSFGGGTANTEFEIITGMNLDDFGLGEYPYKTVLKNHVCESMPFYLKDYGYSTAALHNNQGDFYGRNEVFPQLGFDSFTSIEYISEYETTETGWAKDDCLVDEILGVLQSTDSSDMIYSISVEGHGEYPTTIDPSAYQIQVEDPDEITGNPSGFMYYVNQIYDMDLFVKHLTEALEKYAEPTVLVMYGDHLPSFDLEPEDLENEELYQTRYVIWDNIGLEKLDHDVEAYQLSALVMDRLDLEGGVVNRLHHSYLTEGFLLEESYLEALRVLEYDLLYGDCEAYDGVLPYSVTDMQMGYHPITITSAENVYQHIAIRGEGFTQSSRVFINDVEKKTIYNGAGELLVDETSLQKGDVISVRQYSTSGVCLSVSADYVKE